MGKRVAIVGAGVGGLAAAIDLAIRGFDVAVIESGDRPGGKLRPVAVGGRLFDVGPTVLTMRWVFDRLFEDAGASFADAVSLEPLAVIARHAWSESERLDLFADPTRSADAIAAFAGVGEARAFEAFRRRAKLIYDRLEAPFILSPRASLPKLIAGGGLAGFPALCRISPYTKLWSALGRTFRDPRLRQLFGRYATYFGSSPFAAQATLMLIAHVEQQGVWNARDGMHTIAAALANLATARGVEIVCGEKVEAIEVAAGRAAALRLGGGRRIAADAIVANCDANAVATGLLGEAVRPAVAPTRPPQRSLSAVTFAMLARTEGFALTRHNVFFSRDYPAEFEAIFGRSALAAEPTIYVCAEDRVDDRSPGPGAAGEPERLFCVINAPPVGDAKPFGSAEVKECEETMFRLLARCGLRIRVEGPSQGRPEGTTIRASTPTDFERSYTGTGGALYGRASHGWTASFRRPGVRTRIPGLYLAGGSTHPGAGVPMAALSGRIAAATLAEDLGSTARSRGTAMRGGMSTR